MAALELPKDFPLDATVIATDLDHTLIWKDGALSERTAAVLKRAEAAGLRVLIVTGRMVRSLNRVVPREFLGEPTICYQGAVVVDADGTWLRHVTIEPELAREAVTAVEGEGYSPNVYIDDELYVKEQTEWSEMYANFQGLTITAVGDLAAWLSEPPTKLICVGEPDALDGLEVKMKERFAGRLTISKSLPYFLEFSAYGCTKGSGLDFLAARMGFTPAETVCFGDGENDVELVGWGGFGVAVENAHARVKAVADWVCPPAAEEGVASVIEALLDSRK